MRETKNEVMLEAGRKKQHHMSLIFLGSSIGVDDGLETWTGFNQIFLRTIVLHILFYKTLILFKKILHFNNFKKNK